MRRRKSNRGRPRKAKTDNNNVPKDVSPVSAAEADDCELEASKNIEINEQDYDARLNKIGPTTYRIGSTQLDMENAGDDLKPIFRDNDILFQVECGSNKAQMYLSKLCQGSKGSCIQYDGSWLTPNEFQFVSGREMAKDWKRSIRHFGRSLKLLLTKGILAVHPTACRCDSCCFLTSTDDKPTLNMKPPVKKSKSKSKSKGRPRRVKNAKENRVSRREKNVKDGDNTAENCDAEPMEEGDYQDSTEDGSAEDESENENGDASESGAASDSGGDVGEETEEENGNDVNNSGNEGKAPASSGSEASSDSEFPTDSSDTEQNNEGDANAAGVDTEQCEKEEEDDEDEEQDGEEEDMDTANAAAEKEKDPVSDAVSDEKETEKKEELKVDDTTDKDPTDVKEDTNAEDDSSPIADDKDDSSDKESVKVETKDTISVKATTTDSVQMHQQKEELGCSTLMDKIAETIEQEMEKMDDDDSSHAADDGQQTCKPASPIKFETPSSIKIESLTYESDEQESKRKTEDEDTEKHVDDSDVKDSTDVKQEVVLEKVELYVKPETDVKCNILKDKDIKVESSVVEAPTRQDSPTELVSTPANTPPADTPPADTPPANTPPESPARRCVDKANSSQGKSRLSSIIDILRTSKERECQKPISEPEPRCQAEKAPSREPAVPTPPAPKPREKPDPPKPKPPTEDALTKDRPHNAFRYPASLLPFGYPSPEHLEKVSREAHDQLSKYHRQFEKNLESMIAQNMNPFIPELSIYSLPEHRAQMELHYIQTMEQLARQQYAMAENRSRQMIHENNLLIGKLHDRIVRGGTPSHPSTPQHNNVVNSKHGEKKAGSGSEKRTSSHHNQQQHHRDQANHSQSHHPPKVQPAHRHVPDTRQQQLDKQNQSRLQSPPAAHGHHTSTHPSSVSGKPSSSSSSHASFLPSASTASSAAHPRPESVPTLSSSPLTGTLLPQQMWSSCFPFVVPPPSLETTRLTQFFPNLNSGVRPSKESLKHPSSTPSSALDLSTKKQKLSRHSDVHTGRVTQTDMLSAKAIQNHMMNSASHSQALRRSLQEGKSASLSSDHERRNGTSGCTCGLKHVDDIRMWSVKDVCHFVKRLDGCSMYSEIFLRYRVDGRSLPLLTTDHLTKSFGMKLGSALILTGAIARKLQDISQIVPCDYCRKKISRE